MFTNIDYYFKYLKYKNKYILLKNNYIKKKNIMHGGAGFPLRITNGIDFFLVSSYSHLINLQEKIKKMEGGDWFTISKHIYKYATKESRNGQRNSVLVITQDEFKELKKLAIELGIVLY